VKTRVRTILLGAALTVAMLAAGAWLITKPNIPFEENDPAFVKPGDPARGELIFAAGDCSSCHATPGQKNRLQLGGGLALASPFGTFRPPNISQDAKDGIGSWTAADLGNALIGGVSPNRQHYYPVFPYPSYTGMTVDDVRDLFAYLKTLPAVSGRAPPHDLVALFRIRRFVGFWKLLFFDEGKSEAVLNGDTVHDRGAYLAENVAHCAECHSSRNVFGAIKQAARYAGGEDPEGTGFVPNITPARIGDWSQADIVEVLTSGNTPDHGRVGSSMADVVTNTAKLPAGDRDAIAAYIKSLPARATPKP
jgi:mono/diheme cytochrome c family protein